MGNLDAGVWSVSYTHLDVYKRQIEYKGQKAELTKNELKILYYLFKNAGKICSRNDIVDFLWDNQLYVDDNALSVNITRIRDKLATDVYKRQIHMFQKPAVIIFIVLIR